jgi:N-acetylneuraminate synthase
MTDRLYVIAEAGVNHNGSLERALEMVDVALAAGADAIKFQTFSADRLAGRDAALAEYQRNEGEDLRTQHDLLKGLELSHEEFVRVQQRCQERGITFLSTGFDLAELAFLVDELHIPIVKIASGDLTFAPLLLASGATGLPVILSTGMADLPEIGRALRFIAAGFAVADGRLERGTRITPDVLDLAWASRDDRRDFAKSVTVLHCTTEYPAAPEHLNLRAMSTIAEEFGTRVGYSDHSLGALASTVAVSLGATVIEKHFTLDPTMEGPDHAASLGPQELLEFVSTLRGVETILGSPVKECQPVEEGNRAVVRRSLVTARPIAAGAVIAEDDLLCRRPAAGRTAFEFWDVVGSPATRDYAAGEYVD